MNKTIKTLFILVLALGGLYLFTQPKNESPLGLNKKSQTTEPTTKAVDNLVSEKMPDVLQPIKIDQGSLITDNNVIGNDFSLTKEKQTIDGWLVLWGDEKDNYHLEATSIEAERTSLDMDNYALNPSQSNDNWSIILYAKGNLLKQQKDLAVEFYDLGTQASANAESIWSWNQRLNTSTNEFKLEVSSKKIDDRNVSYTIWLMGEDNLKTMVAKSTHRIGAGFDPINPILSADLNDDGIPDLVVSHSDKYSKTHKTLWLSILGQDGKYSFDEYAVEKSLAL